MDECYAPSDLMNHVYDSVDRFPLVDDADESETIFEAGDSLSNPYLQVALCWGGVVIVVTVLLMVVSIVWHCCMCFCCCCTLEQRTREKSNVLTWECAVCNVVVILLGLAALGVAFWANISLNDTLLKHQDEVEAYLDILSIGNTEVDEDLLDFLYSVENIRQAVLIAFLVVVIILQLLMAMVTCVSPLCKMSTPIALIVMLIVFAVTTLIAAVITGITFALLILLGDICVGFYELANEDECSVIAQAFTDDIDVFCNDSFQHGFILLVMGCCALVALLVVQCSSSMLAGFLTSNVRKLRHRRKSDVPPPVNPDASAWEAYGTHQILGYTTEGQPVYAPEVQMGQQFSTTVYTEHAPPTYAEVMLDGVDSHTHQRHIRMHRMTEVTVEVETERQVEEEEEEEEEGEEEQGQRGEEREEEEQGQREEEEEEEEQGQREEEEQEAEGDDQQALDSSL